MTDDLFDGLLQVPTREDIAPGAVLLRAFARDIDLALLQAADAVTARSPLHHMQTPGGYTMSVASTSCGPLGWVSGPDGYRYAAHDPRTGQPWPAMPACFSELAQRAAARAGYANFVPDACLINEYAPGAKLSLHQDKDEKDLRAPIVSVSLGLPAVFTFGGLQRSGPVQRYRLVHGDVAVWGGPSRLAFHAVLPLADGQHALLGRKRLNLTFRRVLPV
jgi:DNA oxidative demethylase